jgi:hypothetical protein
MTGRQLVVWVALFTVMMAVVAVGIALAVHRQRQKQAQERRIKPLPKAADRLRQD